MSLLRKLIKPLIGTVVVYITLSIGLVYLSEPVFKKAVEMTPEEIAQSGLNFELNYQSQNISLEARDGVLLHGDIFAADSNITILLVHGILANSFQFNSAAGMLKEATGASVITLDMRGHGQAGGMPGALDYIDQYLDDLNDVMLQLKNEQPNGQIILAGHSMGGGIATRYAQKESVVKPDGYILFAPALGWESPTTRKEESDQNPDFAKLHLPRFIGLAMLNAVGLSSWNDKNVLFFNVPDDAPLKAYSYSSLASMSPEDAAKAIEAIDKPLLVIVGENDEVFYADRYEELVVKNSRGSTHIIERANHNSITHDLSAIKVVKNWFAEQGFK